MSLLCLGLNYQSAPIEVLEGVSLNGDQLMALLGELGNSPEVAEIAGISTCNRTEFYVVAADAAGARSALMQTIEKIRGERLKAGWDQCAYTHRNEGAARHLFRVAAGIESLVVGEAEILGQMRRAYESAQRVGTIGGTLNDLMSRAISFGRRVRVETNISRGNVSVASVAHRMAAQHLRSPKTASLLVLGAGETARTAARHFVDEGVGETWILNRTAAHSEEIAREIGGKTLPLDRLESGLEFADVVVCAVGAPHFIITPRGLADVMARRSDRPIVLIDLSMPRNIDPAVAEIEGVTLFSLDSLEAIARENRQQREGEVARVEGLLEEELQTYLRTSHANPAHQLAIDLHRHNEAIRRNLLDKHGRKLSDSERELLDRFTSSLVRTLFHDATLNIRSLQTATPEGARQLRLLRRLFNLPTDGPHDS